jgi:hypothetical protein
MSRKDDQGKPRWSLLPLQSVAEVVGVLEYGAGKYAPNAWQGVPDARTRYFDALLRHLMAWRGGERVDSESGKLHLAHVACNALFLVWFDLLLITSTPEKDLDLSLNLSAPGEK